MPDKNNEDKAVPTGSEPQDNSAPSKNNSQNQGEDGQNASSQSEGSQKTEGGESQGGNDQTQDTQGQRSTEDLLQTLQKSQQEISEKLDGLQKPAEEGSTQSTEPDYDAQLNELDRMLQEGELNLSDYQTRQRSIMEQKAEAKAGNVVDQKLQEQKLEQASEDYIKQNPDFQQYYNSQEMQKVMKDNPLMDEIGAYEKLKRSEAENALAEKDKQIEQLKQEREQAVKNGAQVTDATGKDPGAALQHGEVENNKNLSPEQGMMAALKRSRQAT